MIETQGEQLSMRSVLVTLRKSGLEFMFTFSFLFRLKRARVMIIFEDHQHCVNFLMKLAAFIMHPAQKWSSAESRRITWCLNYKANRHKENFSCWIRKITRTECLWAQPTNLVLSNLRLKFYKKFLEECLMIFIEGLSPSLLSAEHFEYLRRSGSSKSCTFCPLLSVLQRLVLASSFIFSGVSLKKRTPNLWEPDTFLCRFIIIRNASKYHEYCYTKVGK